MVIYDLCCSSNHRFEGWFSSREDFMRQLGERMILCPLCGTDEITEKPSPPKVHVPRRTARLDAEKQREQKLAQGLRKVPASSPQQGSVQEIGSPGEGDAETDPVKVPRDITALKAATEIIKTILDEHFENVGNRFSEEAIAIHLGDAEPRNLFGTATAKEEAELDELGVTFGKIRLPHFDD